MSLATDSDATTSSRTSSAKQTQCGQSSATDKTLVAASTLLEIINQSKNFSSQSGDNASSGHGSDSVAKGKNVVEIKSATDGGSQAANSTCTKSSQASAPCRLSTQAINAAPLHVGTDKTQEGKPHWIRIALNTTGKSAQTGAAQIETRSMDGLNGGIDAPGTPITTCLNANRAGLASSSFAFETPKTVRVVARAGQIPSLFQVIPFGGGAHNVAQPAHLTGNNFNSANSIAGGKLILASNGSQNSRCSVSPFNVHPISKPTMLNANLQSSTPKETPIKFCAVQSGMGRGTKPEYCNVKDVASKWPISVTFQSSGQVIPINTCPGSQPVLDHLKLHVSGAAMQNASAGISLPLNPSPSLNLAQQSFKPMVLQNVSLLPGTNTLITATDVHTKTVPSTTPPTCITLPLHGGLTTVLPSGAVQAVDQSASQVAFSDKTKSSNLLNHVSASQSVPKNFGLTQVPKIVLLGPTATFEQTNATVNHSISQLPTLSTLLSHQPVDATFQHRTLPPSEKQPSQPVQFISPTALEAANRNMAGNKNEDSSSLCTETIDTVMVQTTPSLSGSSVVDSSIKSLLRPLRPKTTSVVSSSKPKHEHVSQSFEKIKGGQDIQSQQKMQAVRARRDLQNHIKQLIISKESLICLEKITQGVDANKTDKVVYEIVKQSINKPSILGASSGRSVKSSTKEVATNKRSSTKCAGFQTQTQPVITVSKSTRLSTASIPRRSYLKMLRDDVPKEKGTVSLISNRNVKRKKGLEQKSTSSMPSRGSSGDPVYVTTTLRTASGPISVKVRAPSHVNVSEASPGAERSTNSHKYHPASNASEQQFKAKVANHFPDFKTTLGKNPESSSPLKLPVPQLRVLQTHSGSAVTHSSIQFRSVEHNEQRSSSDSDSDFLQDSEEQDLRVLGQLLQQNDMENGQGTRPSSSENHNDIITCDTTPTSAPPHGSTSTEIALEKDKYEPRCNSVESRAAQQSTNSLINLEEETCCEANEDVKDLKIESVFSLNPETASNVNDYHQVDIACTESTVNRRGRYSKLCSSNNDCLVQKQAIVKPCYCVLERLSKTDIERLSSPELDHPIINPGSQCSEHCRRRILTIMCNLNLIHCEFKASSQQQEGELNLNPDDNEVEILEHCSPSLKQKQEISDNSHFVSRLQRLKEMLDVSHRRLSKLNTTERLKSGTVQNESSCDQSPIIIDNSLAVNDKLTLQGNPTESAVSVSATDLAAQNVESPSKSTYPGRICTSGDASRHQSKENKRISFKTLDNSSSSSFLLNKAMYRLKKQIESKRNQMLKDKLKSLRKGKELTNLKLNRVRTKRKQSRFCKNLSVSTRSGEKIRDLTLPGTSQPIVAQLLPSESIHTHGGPSSKDTTRATACASKCSTSNKKIAPKFTMSSDLSRQNHQLKPSQSDKVQWSTKITAALKSLQVFLKTIGRELSGKETQHFLLRIGDQHVLVSVPPSKETSCVPSQKTTEPPSSVATTPASTSDVGTESKGSGGVISAKTAVKRPRETSGNPMESQPASKDIAVDEPSSHKVSRKETANKSVNQSQDRTIVTCNVHTLPTVNQRTRVPRSTIETGNDLSQHCSSTDTTTNTLLPIPTSIGHSSSAISDRISRSHSQVDEHVSTKSGNQGDLITVSESQLPAVQENGAESRAAINVPQTSSCRGKGPLMYGDPSSTLSQLPLDSTLLPTPNRKVRKQLSDGEKVAKRAMLERKYPLPPGVVIKVEPTNLNGAEDTNSLGFFGTVDGPEGELDGPGQAIQVAESTGTMSRPLSDCMALQQIENNSVAQSAGDSLNDIENGTATASGVGTDHFNCETADEPPPLINEASCVSRRRKRLKSRRSTKRKMRQDATDEEPPVLQPMCNPTITQQTSTEMKIFDPERAPAPPLLCHEYHDPEESQCYGSDSGLSAAVLTSCNTVDSSDPPGTSTAGFKATEVSGSKNVRIQRLRELLRKKEQEIETMKKMRSELPSV